MTTKKHWAVRAIVVVAHSILIPVGTGAVRPAVSVDPDGVTRKRLARHMAPDNA